MAKAVWNTSMFRYGARAIPMVLQCAALRNATIRCPSVRGYSIYSAQGMFDVPRLPPEEALKEKAGNLIVASP